MLRFSLAPPAERIRRPALKLRLTECPSVRPSVRRMKVRKTGGEDEEAAVRWLEIT